MPQVKCKICQKDFYVKPCHLKLGHGKCCSMKCRAQYMRKGKYVICEICGEETWKMPKTLKRSKSGKFFCSKSCQTKWRNVKYSGKNHPFWKGRAHIYRDVMLKNKIKPKCKKCGAKDFRVLIVHHLDCNRKNSKIENLTWLCRNCHYLIHNHQEKI